jgi:hypothetical protein
MLVALLLAWLVAAYAAPVRPVVLSGNGAAHKEAAKTKLECAQALGIQWREACAALLDKDHVAQLEALHN